MALSARLEIRQGQSLVITPQLQQAIKLLQLSNLELDAFVDGELEKNPLLDRDDRDGAPEREGEATALTSGDADLTLSHDGPSGEAEASLDVRHDDLHDAAPGDRAMGDAGDAPAPTDWSKPARAAPPSTARTTWRARWPREDAPTT
jgi:RNA polymerase sigma-54 factor